MRVSYVEPSQPELLKVAILAAEDKTGATEEFNRKYPNGYIVHIPYTQEENQKERG